MMKADEIIKVLNDLCEKFGIAIDWSSKNVLPYIQKLGDRIVAYELWTSVIWILVNLLLFVVSIIVFVKVTKWCNSEDFDDVYETLVWLCCIATVGGIIACFCFMIKEVFDIVTCLVFPEKVIVESCMEIYNTYK